MELAKNKNKNEKVEVTWWYNTQGLCFLCKKPCDAESLYDNQVHHDDCWGLRFQPKICRCCPTMYQALAESWLEWNRKTQSLNLHGECSDFEKTLVWCPWCGKKIDYAKLEDNPFFEPMSWLDGYEGKVVIRWLETGKEFEG